MKKEWKKWKKKKKISADKYRRIKEKERDNRQRANTILGPIIQEYVFKVLKNAQEQGALISRVEMPPLYSPEDRKGCDIIVYDTNGKEYPLQIKSSFRRAHKFIRRRAALGLPEIPVIVARLNDTPQEILRKAAKVLPFVRKFKFKIQPV